MPRNCEFHDPIASGKSDCVNPYVSTDGHIPLLCSPDIALVVENVNG